MEAGSAEVADCVGEQRARRHLGPEGGLRIALCASAVCFLLPSVTCSRQRASSTRVVVVHLTVAGSSRSSWMRTTRS